MDTLRPVLAGLLGVVFLGGCGPKPCMDGEGIAPGQGLSIDGAPLCLGETSVAVTERLGAPSSSGDLGNLGARFAHATLFLSGFYSADAREVTSLTVTPGYEGRTAGGTGIGSSEADVRTEFGEPLVDPFAGGWVYPDQGIALQLQDGAVVSILVFSPASM